MLAASCHNIPVQRWHTLLFVLTMSAACGRPTETTIVGPRVGTNNTPISVQATTPIHDAGVSDATVAPAAPPATLACSDDTHVTAAPYPDPTWFCARADGTRHGPFVTLFPDRQIAIEGSYKNGALDGAWQRRHPGGALAETGTYVDGLPDGLWRQLAPSGAVLGEYRLTLGTGTQKRWLDDGTLYSETQLARGVRHGMHRIFDRDGTVIASERYRSGKLDGKRFAGTKDTVRVEEAFVRGTRRGARRIWQSRTLVFDEAYDAKGKLHGAFTIRRKHRTPRVTGTYDHGERAGTWVWTDSRGRKEREGTYASSKKVGTWREWIGGRLSSQISFVSGVPHGELVRFDRSGGELGRSRFTNGTGTKLTFHPNKRVATRTRLVKGLREGKYEVLAPSGKVVIEGRYLHDLEHGLWRERTETGAPVLERHYKHGKLDGAWKKYVDGKLAVEATYKDGLADGTYTEYRDGKPALVGQFAADKRTGTWTTYGADGTVTLVATYKDGVLDGPWRQVVRGTVLEGQMSGGRRVGTWTQTDRAGQKTSVTYSTP